MPELAGVPSEEFITQIFDVMNESLAIDGDFSYSVNVDNDSNYSVVIFAIQRTTEPRTAAGEIVEMKIFDGRFKLAIPVDKITEQVRWALNNMPIYIKGVHALRIQMQYLDPTQPEKICMLERCGRTFRGPAFYCCHDHAMEDSGADQFPISAITGKAL